MPTLLGILDGSTEYDSGIKIENGRPKAENTYGRTYLILADDCNDTADDVMATTGIPLIGDSCPGGYIDGIRPREQATVIHPNTGVKTILWELEVSGTSDYDPASGGPSDDPTDWTDTLRWYTWEEEELLERDVITGEPIQTKAKEPISLTRPVKYPVLEITRYEVYPYDPNNLLTYVNKINSANLWGAPVGSVLLDDIKVEEETIENVKYCRVTYVLKFKITDEYDETSDPWQAHILHQGTQYVAVAQGDPIEIAQIAAALDVQGEPITVNLDEEGFILPPASAPVFLDFNRYKKIDFAPLNLEAVLGP